MRSVLEQESVLGDWGGPRVRDLLVVSLGEPTGNLQAFLEPELLRSWEAAGGRFLVAEQARSIKAWSSRWGSACITSSHLCLIRFYGHAAMLHQIAEVLIGMSAAVYKCFIMFIY